MPTKSTMNVIGSHTGNLMSSNQGAVDGCVGGPNSNLSNARNKMIQNGGRLSYGFDMSTTTGVGLRGGIPNVKVEHGCGVKDPLNMGASSQAMPQSGGNPHNNYEGAATYGFKGVLPEHAGDFRGSYAPIEGGTRPICATPMSGGARALCKDFRKVRSFKDVESFWKLICPGAVMVYNKYVSHKEKTHPTMVLELVKAYTKAFCHEEKALKSHNKIHVRIHLKSLKSSMKRVERLMKQMKLNGLRMHHKVESMHIARIENHLMKLKSHSKTRKANRKSRGKGHKKSQRRSSRNMSKKSKNGKRGNKHTQHKKRSRNNRKSRKSMKGGYHQYMSNSQNTMTLSLPGAASLPGGSNANPPTHTALNTCTGIYDHYSGKSIQAPVTDKALM
jgi:hypothetical protein